jgi:transposase
MQLHCNPADVSAIRAFATATRCTHCGDRMVAPFVSEFVVGGEIRHHWECDACGQASTTSFPLAQR